MITHQQLAARSRLPNRDGVGYVDLSTIPFREIPGQWAWTIRVNDYVDGGE